ncbi:MAG: FHA domain-containing protein [Anaerolineae bacterium]
MDDEPKKPDTVPERQIQTKQLDTGQFNPELREKIKSLRNTYTSGERKLILHFPATPEPVVLNTVDTITLGRTDLRAGIHPTIDLTEYNGALLGVSRFHAEIKLVNGSFHIKDMGSTNGTRINDTKIPAYRLIPFRSGDTLRLGHLNIIVG